MSRANAAERPLPRTVPSGHSLATGERTLEHPQPAAPNLRARQTPAAQRPAWRNFAAAAAESESLCTTRGDPVADAGGSWRRPDTDKDRAGCSLSRADGGSCRPGHVCDRRADGCCVGGQDLRGQATTFADGQAVAAGPLADHGRGNVSSHDISVSDTESARHRSSALVPDTGWPDR